MFEHVSNIGKAVIFVGLTLGAGISSVRAEEMPGAFLMDHSLAAAALDHSGTIRVSAAAVTAESWLGLPGKGVSSDDLTDRTVRETYADLKPHLGQSGHLAQIDLATTAQPFQGVVGYRPDSRGRLEQTGPIRVDLKPHLQNWGQVVLAAAQTEDQALPLAAGIRRFRAARDVSPPALGLRYRSPPSARLAPAHPALRDDTSR